MRRAKKKYSTTGKFAGANRLDKYWAAWAQRQALASEPGQGTVRVIGGAHGFRCRWGHRHGTTQALERCQALLG